MNLALKGLSESQIAATVSASGLSASQIAAALNASNLGSSEIAATLATMRFSEEATKAALMSIGLSKAQADAAMANLSFATTATTATTATVGFTSVLGTLKAVAVAHPFMAIVTAITALIGVVSVVTNLWKKHNESIAEAQQATKEAAQAHLDAANSIDEYKTKIKELREELDSGNLSTEDAYEKRKQLISIQDELVDKIGNEAKAFNILKDSLDDVNSALDQYTAKEANNLLTENRDAFDTAVKEMKKVRNLGNGMDNTIANRSFISLPENKEIYEQVQQIFNDVFGNAVNFKELGDGRIAYELKVDAKTAADGLAEVNSQMYNLDKELSRDHRSLNEVLGLDSFDQSWENAITVAKKEAQAVLDEFSDNYDNMVQLKIQAEYEVDNSIVPEIVSDIDKIKESYETAIKEGNDEAAKQAYENMQEMVPKIGKIEDEDIADYLSGVVDAFNENAKKFNFEIELKAKLADDKNAVSRMVKNAVNQFKTENGNFDRNAFVTAQYNYQNRQNPTVSNADERAYVDLKKAADDYDMSVEELIDTLEELGYVQSDNADIADEASDSVMSLADTVNSLADAEKNIKGLSEVFNEFNEKGAASVSSLSELSETFGNLSSYNDFIKVMSDSASTAEEAKAAWSQLAQEYINSLDVLDNVTASNMGVIESFLNQMGVVNAHEVVMSSLSAVQLEAIVAANGLADATWEETNKFLEQEGVAESTREALRQYRIEQLNAAMSATNLANASASTVSALLSQANAAGVAASSLAALKASMAALTYNPDTYNPEKSVVGSGGIRAYEKIAAQKNQEKKGLEFNFDFSKVKSIGSGSGGGGGGGSSKEDDPTKELKEQLDKLVSDFEHQIFILEKKGVSTATSVVDNATQTAKQIVNIYSEMQAAVNQQANKYRSMGLDENSAEIQALQKQWWEYKENVQETMTSCYEYIQKQHENAITLNEDWLEGAIENHDYDGISKYTGEIVSHYKDMQDQLHQQAEYYRSLGYSDTSDEVSKLSDLWWQYYNEIKDVSANAWQEIVDNSHEALDSIENVYDTLKNAAQEFSESGFITVSTFQEIAKLGVENLAYLQDENGQLVINEANIQKVIAARTQQMAIETALNYIQQLRQALMNNDTVALMNLTNATNIATQSTWDLVYAQLQLLGLDSQQYNNALNRINALRSLADVAVTSIGQVEGAVEEARKAAYEATKKQADALDDLLKYVMDMIRQEVENQVDALEAQIDKMRDIVDLQKKSLDLEREKDQYSKSVAEKTKELAKLQQQLSLLELDTSRESIAKQQQLREQMAELSNDLSEEQADKAYDSASDALDDMFDSYEKEKQKEIDVLENTISSEEKVYRLAIQRIETQWDSLYQQLLDWNYEYGNVTDNEITAAWNSASEAVQQYGSYLEAILQTQKQIAEYEASSSSSYSSTTTGSGSDKNGTSNVVGITGNYDTSGGQVLAQAKNIIKQMYNNGQSWAATSDQNEKKRLDEANLALGEQLQRYVPGRVYRKNGTWYVDNELLFNKYKQFIYHRGGIAGDEPTLKQKEVHAKLEKGEMVLTEHQQDSLFKVLDAQETMLAKYGRLFSAMSGNNLMAEQMQSQIKQDAKAVQSVVENNDSGHYEINIPMQVYPLQTLDDSEIQGLTRAISDYTIKELDEVFALRGKRSLRR